MAKVKCPGCGADRWLRAAHNFKCSKCKDVSLIKKISAPTSSKSKKKDEDEDEDEDAPTGKTFMEKKVAGEDVVFEEEQ